MVTSTRGAFQSQLAVSIAQKRKLVSSWLPPPTAEELAAQKPEDELLREEARLFAPVPPTLGVGFPIPEEYTNNSKSLVSNEALRRTLLGKRAHGSATGGKTNGVKKEDLYSRKKARLTDSEESSEEEDGRGSLGSSRRKQVKQTTVKQATKDESKEKENAEDNDAWPNTVEDEEDKLIQPAHTKTRTSFMPPPSPSQESFGFIITNTVVAESKSARKKRRRRERQAQLASTSSVLQASSSSSSVPLLELLDGSVVPDPTAISTSSESKVKKKNKLKRKVSAEETEGIGNESL